MNNAYIFLLKKRYNHKWKNLKEKLKYYFDFSIIYIALALGIVFNLYRNLIVNPPLILQSIASFLSLIPLNFITTISLLMLIQYSIKGLKTPPIHFDKGDTYFLFTLPIPKKHYIFFEYILAQGKNILIVLGVLVIALPVYPLIWDAWFVHSVKIFFIIAILLISLGNAQWLVFQLPMKIKRIILKILRYIRITFLVIFIISILSIAWMLIFNNNALFDFNPQITTSVYTPQAFNFKVSFLMLLGFGFFSTVLSIYFFKRTSLEGLKESSLSYAKIQTLMSLGMTRQAKKIMNSKTKKEKRYFLSIPGYYKNTNIFLWRNLSQFIKQPFEFIYSYIIYLALSISIIIFTKGEAISLVFIFIALYILGQNMLSPIKKHYEESFFLSSFPVQSIFILRGYVLLPLILVITIGVGFSLLMGWMYKGFWIASILILNIPFFSYYTLLAAMRNTLEEINFVLNTNKTLVMESTLLIQGATPIVFGILFSKGGVPLWVVGLGAAIGYLMMIKAAEKEAIRPLQEVFNKYS